MLGLGSLVAPSGIPVPDAALAFDVPVMLAVSVAALPVLFTGHTIARWEGAVFLGYYVAYATYLVLDASGQGATTLLATAMTWFAIPLTVLTIGTGVVRAVRDPALRAP